jgi:hypothetical protein
MAFKASVRSSRSYYLRPLQPLTQLRRYSKSPQTGPRPTASQETVSQSRSRQFLPPNLQPVLYLQARCTRCRQTLHILRRHRQSISIPAISVSRLSFYRNGRAVSA